MKRILLTILILLSVSADGLSAKEKVVEASARRKPQWIGLSTESAFAVTEVAETLAAASGQCLASVRQYIINAVAVNVSSTETMQVRQVSRDNLITVMHDYNSVLMTEAAKLPYLNNISLSNAEEIYWERIYDKQTKQYRYEYSVLYPFDESVRRQLVDEFLRIDNAKVAEMKRLAAEYENITDLDVVRTSINRLEALREYFFDAARKSEVETLIKNYNAVYGRLSIVPETEMTGKCIYSLRLSGRRVTTSVVPRLKSDSAVEMSVSQFGNDMYELSYNADYASAADINTIEIMYPFGSSRVSKSIGFSPDSKVGPVTPYGEVHIAQSGKEIEIRMPLRVNAAHITVERLSIYNPADEGIIESSAVEPALLSHGEREVKAVVSGGIVGRASNGIDVVRGRLTVSDSGVEPVEIQFILPYKLTFK